jgi:hypothetical protein
VVAPGLAPCLSNIFKPFYGPGAAMPKEWPE